MFDKYIDENKDNIINSICELIKFPSISVEDFENSTHPFGKTCTQALEYVLNLGKSMGFRTKNIDNYCGYIEFGEGEELVGIIGHLDVVPANKADGWSTDPFEPNIKNGKLFGRGSVDDKGPVISALYAMKAVFENTKVNKRVRLILGLNEEKGWKCIDRYKQTEEFPSISFSPDANFPGIYAEKGIMSVELKHEFYIKGMKILEINCENNAINVVPKYCSITLQAENELPHLESLQDSLFKKNIEIEKINDYTIKIISHGVAAHAAHPELGVNAITNLVHYLIENFEIIADPKFEYLKKLYELGLFEFESPEFLSRKDIAYPTEFDEESVIQDESGILTSNIAILEYKDNNIIIKINLRVPVHTTLESIQKKYQSLINIFESIEVSTFGHQLPLYVEKDSYLVKTLVDIFNKKTGLNTSPVAIGGGTYARAFDNSISYGINFPGDLDMCHQVDEFIEIDKLILGTKIYAETIYELSK